MAKHNDKNTRIKRQYFDYLEQAKRMSATTVNRVAADISQYEEFTKLKDFAAFHIDDVRRYKQDLADSKSAATGTPLSKTTIYHRLKALKAFFQWLAGKPGYKSRITYADAEYFNPSNHDTHIAKAVREKPIPSLAQIRRVLGTMPFGTDIEKRDRAVVAFTILTGARDDAVASMQIGQVDLARRRIYQDARNVRTKFRKTFHSDFFPVGDDIEAIVIEWITHLSETLLYGPSEPLFPVTRVAVGTTGHFERMGLDRRPWKNASAIRGIFKAAFISAGLPYFNPHSFRDCLVNLADQLDLTPEGLKSWSQNLGHEGVMTTLRNYGKVTGERQTEIFSQLRTKGGNGAAGGDETPDRETVDYHSKLTQDSH